MDRIRLSKIRRKLVLLAILMIVVNTVSFFEWNKVRNDFNATADCPESLDFFNKTMDLTASTLLMKGFHFANVMICGAIIFFCGANCALNFPQKRFSSYNFGAVLISIGCHCFQVADVARKRKCVEKVIIHFFSAYQCSNQNAINEVASHIIIGMICLVTSLIIVLLFFIKAFELHIFARDYILELDIPMGVLFGARDLQEPPIVRRCGPVTYNRLRNQLTLPIVEPAPEISDYDDDGLPNYEEALRLRDEQNQNRVGQETVQEEDVLGQGTATAANEYREHMATQTEEQYEDLSISESSDMEIESGDKNSGKAIRSDNDDANNEGGIQGPSQGDAQ